MGYHTHGLPCFCLSREEAAAGSDETKTMYPALTKEEIEEWLEHVPVFAVTDSNGAGVVLRPENDTSVFYFFLNPMQANATLTQLKGVNEDNVVQCRFAVAASQQQRHMTTVVRRP